MLTLVLLLIFGSTVAFFALQNTIPVTLRLADYTFPDLPLFYVMIGSMLVGVLLAYILYLINFIATKLTIRGKDKKIKEEEEELTEATKRLHQLELENAELKKESGQVDVDDKSL